MTRKTIAVLRSEHELIEAALDRLEAALDPLDMPVAARCLEFFTKFADEVHHAKEEEVLFPTVVSELRDMASGAIAAMTKEHFMGRAYLRAAARCYSDAAHGDDVAASLFNSSLSSYVVLMRAHIQKENGVLYPFVERAISEEADEAMLVEMKAVETQTADEGEIQRLRKLIEAPLPNAKPASFLDARTLSDGNDERTGDGDIIFGGNTGGILFDDGGHQNIRLADFGRGMAVQANQFLIVNRGVGMVLDPGGPKVYPDVYAETNLRLRGGKLKYIFLSHQDPDIGTSLNAWLMDTEADAYISRLWVRFVPHFGIDRLLEDRLKPIPDEGMRLELGNAELHVIPAHFLHSSGNFQIYDPRSKILYSGDLGASLGSGSTIVSDFDEHVKSMLGFHQRYMPCNKALRIWANTVKDLDIEAIAPQHGALLSGRPIVKRFIEWCETLECGVDLVSKGLRWDA